MTGSIIPTYFNVIAFFLLSPIDRIDINHADSATSAFHLIVILDLYTWLVYKFLFSKHVIDNLFTSIFPRHLFYIFSNLTERR